MSTERFWAAAFLFHLLLLAYSLRLAGRWRSRERCAAPTPVWLRALVADGLKLGAAIGLLSVAIPVLLVLPHIEKISKITASANLVGQGLIVELVLATGLVALRHRRVNPPRAALLGLAFAVFAGAQYQGYVREPQQLVVRHHKVDPAPGAPAGSLRILHLTDIQTPSIGAHEERALREGLAQQPDLIVLTGDYVQNLYGRRTEDTASRDLRALMARIGFGAPLGVYATEGDAGPPCNAVFRGSVVRCLVDDSTQVTLRDGQTLSITGLSRSRGRDRSSVWLAALVAAAPESDHHIVISHAPDFVDTLAGHADVDLVLAGHTHGGQVVMPGFGPIFTASRLPRRFAGDLNDFRGVPLHVSRGVGMERGFAPQVRFLCPPEICVLDVRLPRRQTELYTAAFSASRSPRLRSTPQR
jgi:predicted MPP superfamily phosphohydrolase